VDGERLRAVHIYVAPPDCHLLVAEGHLHLTHGPHQDHWRPSVDALFRSAAHCYGERAIGGVNEKVEGFFALCAAKGLTGDQGVLIPAANVPNLMLREEVVEAVRNGRFHIYPVATVSEGITLLTDIPAGAPGEDGEYPPDTIFVASMRGCGRWRKRWRNSMRANR